MCFDARRHGVVLARPFTKALVLAGAGGILVAQPWPLLVPGAVLVLLGALLALRAGRQKEFDAGKLPDFLPGTRSIREGNWTCAGILPDIVDRRVEITGPVDRKMIINGLNSGAQVFMADFEDATAPTWANVVEGQRNLQDAVRGGIRHVAPDTGKVTGYIDLRGLLSPQERLAVDANGGVLNGIAYDAARDRLFITGKLWPKLFEVKIVSK